MTVKLASLKADLDREEKGDWIEYPEWPGVEFNVSSLHLSAFQIQRDLLYQRLGRIYKKKPVPRDVLNVELGKLYCKHILHDWKGLDVPYTPETAVEVMTNPEYRNVIAAVEYCAAKVSDFEVEFIEDAAKNSASPSEAA